MMSNQDRYRSPSASEIYSSAKIFLNSRNTTEERDTLSPPAAELGGAGIAVIGVNPAITTASNKNLAPVRTTNTDRVTIQAIFDTNAIDVLNKNSYPVKKTLRDSKKGNQNQPVGNLLGSKSVGILEEIDSDNIALGISQSVPQDTDTAVPNNEVPLRMRSNTVEENIQLDMRFNSRQSRQMRRNRRDKSPLLIVDKDTKKLETINPSNASDMITNIKVSNNITFTRSPNRTINGLDHWTEEPPPMALNSLQPTVANAAVTLTPVRKHSASSDISLGPDPSNASILGPCIDGDKFSNNAQELRVLSNLIDREVSEVSAKGWVRNGLGKGPDEQEKRPIGRLSNKRSAKTSLSRVCTDPLVALPQGVTDRILLADNSAWCPSVGSSTASTPISSPCSITPTKVTTPFVPKLVPSLNGLNGTPIVSGNVANTGIVSNPAISRSQSPLSSIPMAALSTPRSCTTTPRTALPTRHGSLPKGIESPSGSDSLGSTLEAVISRRILQVSPSAAAASAIPSVSKATKSKEDDISDVAVGDVLVKDDIKARQNDSILQDRLQQAKALNRKDDNGAVMHQFSLWTKAKQPQPMLTAATPNVKPQPGVQAETEGELARSLPKPLNVSGLAVDEVTGTAGADQVSSICVGQVGPTLRVRSRSNSLRSDVSPPDPTDTSSAVAEDKGTPVSTPLSVGTGMASALRSRVGNAKLLASPSSTHAPSPTENNFNPIARRLPRDRVSIDSLVIDEEDNDEDDDIFNNDHDDFETDSVEEEEELQYISVDLSRNGRPVESLDWQRPQTAMSVHSVEPDLEELQEEEDEREAREESYLSSKKHSPFVFQSLPLARNNIPADSGPDAQCIDLVPSEEGSNIDDHLCTQIRENSRMSFADSRGLLNNQIDIVGPSLSANVDTENAEKDTDSEDSNISPTLSELSEEECEVNGASGRIQNSYQKEEAESESDLDADGNSFDIGMTKLSWKKGQPIGEGTFGQVFKGLNERTGELLALKQISLADGTEEEVDKLQQEIRLMRRLKHVNIVRYIGTDRSERHLFILMEFVPGGSIASMLSQFGAFTEELLRRFVYQILLGVSYLHERGIIHRDIKGANVLVTDGGVVKLADFGCSKQLAGMCTTTLEESLRVIRGSVPWMAPEVIKQTGLGRSSDIWSVGATVIEMATGRHPWPEFNNNMAALFHVATSKEPPPAPAHLSPSCRAFIKRCLVIEPKERGTAKELLLDGFLSVEANKNRNKLQADINKPRKSKGRMRKTEKNQSKSENSRVRHSNRAVVDDSVLSIPSASAMSQEHLLMSSSAPIRL